APAAADKGRPARVERGVVQAVTPVRIALRTLDGTWVAAVVDRKTRVVVDGARAAIIAIRPGFVAVVSYRPDGRVARDIAASASGAAVPPRPGGGGGGAPGADAQNGHGHSKDDSSEGGKKKH